MGRLSITDIAPFSFESTGVMRVILSDASKVFSRVKCLPCNKILQGLILYSRELDWDSTPSVIDGDSSKTSGYDWHHNAGPILVWHTNNG
jgi:hypothetical protein